MRWIQRQEPAASEHRRKIRARKKDVLGSGNLEDSIIRRTEYKTGARQGICGTGARTPRMLSGYQRVVVESKPGIQSERTCVPCILHECGLCPSRRTAVESKILWYVAIEDADAG